MERRFWINIFMVILVGGLFLTVSCAPQTVVFDTDQTGLYGKKLSDRGHKKTDIERIADNKISSRRASSRDVRRVSSSSNDDGMFQTIYFRYDSSEIDFQAKEILKDIAMWLKKRSSASITIEGHCDERGTIEYNLSLGERRADAVKDYFIDLGISPFRINTISYGEERPVEMGFTESSYRLNRRARFVVDSKGY